MAARGISKAWSCGSFIAGAAEISDQMAAPAADVVAQKKALLAETADLSAAELEKLLEVWMGSSTLGLCRCLSLWSWLEFGDLRCFGRFLGKGRFIVHHDL